MGSLSACRLAEHLSDIHGNLPALEAVVADARARGCTAFVNLGDILSGPLWPRETADYLMDLGWPTISGNHDRELATGTAETMGRSDSHALAELDTHHLDWLRGLPADLALREDLYLCHANPADDIHYLMHRVEPDLIRDAHAHEIAEMLEVHTHPAIGCGHSHLPRHVVLEDGRQVFNPGSVGLPAYAWDYPHIHRMEVGSTHARSDTCNSPVLIVQLRRRPNASVSIHPHCDRVATAASTRCIRY